MSARQYCCAALAAVLMMTAPASARCPCDEDSNDVVDVTDLLIFLEDWLSRYHRFEGTDDVTVIEDLLEFLECWFPAVVDSIPCD